ncbi:MAG TPA: CGNR zinc finger domain-containing protein [Gemmatimonadaceae bacterium]
MPPSTARAVRPIPDKPPLAEFIGNHPALDFHNTLAWPSPEGVNERFYSPQDLINWCRTAGILTTPEARALTRRAQRHAGEATRVLAEARRLRKILHDALSPIAHRKRVRERDLDRLNTEVRRALASFRLGESGRTITWANDPRAGLSVIVHRLAWSAAQLLTSQELARLSSCANERCGWLFLDESRNQSRRWCSMEECGSRAKARRYYRRTKRGSGRKSARI